MKPENIKYLFNIMNEEMYSKDDIIYKENIEDDCSLYFLTKGKIEIY